MTTYNMAIETAEGVKPHGFHLGTHLGTAETFVWERLRAGARSVALYLGSAHPGFGGKLVKVYDFRDLPEYDGGEE